MAQQRLLFPNDPPALRPARDRREPVLWIKRIKILESPDPNSLAIRDVEFRRGLNIIRSLERRPDERERVGHSVGKSMLMRLIRYCLGEQHYTRQGTRPKIHERLPDAHVLAEFIVGGQSWVVRRPLGAFGRTSVACSNDFLGLDDPNLAQIGMTPLTEAISQATIAPLHDLHLPSSKRGVRWLDLLGWLARDQECHFARHHEWRDPESESGTGVLPREDASLLMRGVMDLVNNQERKLRRKHKRLLSELTALRKERDRLDAYVSLEEQELRATVRPPIDDDAPRLAEAVKENAEVKIRQLERFLESELAEVGLEDAEQAWHKADKDLSALRQELYQKRGYLTTQEEHLKQLEQPEATNRFAAFAIPRRWCPYFEHKADADVAGCPGEEAPSTNLTDPHRQQSMSNLREHIQVLRDEIEPLQEAEISFAQARDDAYSELQRRQQKIEGLQRAIGEKAGAYKQTVERAKRLKHHAKQLDDLPNKIRTKKASVRASLAIQTSVRKDEARKQRKLETFFDQALKGLLGPKAGGRIETNAQGIYPRPSAATAASGAALATSTVLAFDMACLIGSIAGLGFHPRFLIHDSPREADMEVVLYHDFLRYIAGLEEVFSGHEPSFQYIVTTTTAPPDELAGGKFVRLKLHARHQEGLLLKVKF